MIADATTIEAIRKWNRRQTRARRAYYAALPHDDTCDCVMCRHRAHNRAHNARKRARKAAEK